MAAFPGRYFKIANTWFKDVTNETATGGIMSYKEAWYYAHGRYVTFGSLAKPKKNKYKNNEQGGER